MSAPHPDQPGTLKVAATPIGNLGDASERLREALAEADCIAAEDTRRLHRLVDGLHVQPVGTIVSYFAGNEARRTDQLVDRLRQGQNVLLVSDAGMPTVSDPGFRLISACVAEGISVTVLPGPSAVLAALALSGLPADRFVFDGFLPRKGRARAEQIAGYRDIGRSVVLFESARRLAATLTDLGDALGSGTPAAVCRELTKTHEEVRRGSLSELAEWADRGVLGECVVVIGEPEASMTSSAPVDWSEGVADLMARGLSKRDAVDQVARAHGVSRREVYEVVLGRG